MLSYYFTIEWDWPGVEEYLMHVLGGFAVPDDPGELRSPPTPGLPPKYRLVDAGKGRRGRYRLFFGAGTLIASRQPSDALFHLFWHINSETIRRTGDFLLIHSGAVQAPGGGGVLLPAASGSGKTTLVAGLVRAGFGYLSDEAAAIDPVSRKVYPYPKALTLKQELATLFPDISLPPVRRQWMDGQYHLRPEDLHPAPSARPCTVALVIAPRYVEGASIELTPMTPGEAAVELGRNALNLSLYRSRALPVLADVVGGARSYRLVSGNLGEAVAVVQDLAANNARRE